MKVEVMKIRENAVIPTRGSEKAAGFDLYAAISSPVSIEPGCTEKIGSGIAAAIPDGYVGLVFARSGLATKRGLRPANCVGVIDSDYRGEIIVVLYNDDPGIKKDDNDLAIRKKPQNDLMKKVINPGDRIAQLVIVPYLDATLVEKNELDGTERGSGGFGSTGTN